LTVAAAVLAIAVFASELAGRRYLRLAKFATAWTQSVL